MACPAPATSSFPLPVVLAVASWLLGIITTVVLGRLKTAFGAVPLCLKKLDEAASAAERAMWCMGGGKADPTDRALAFTLKSDLGTLTTRAFGSNPDIAKRVAMFGFEFRPIDPESSQALKSNAAAQQAVDRMRSAQRILRNEIRATRRGKLACWLSGDSA